MRFITESLRAAAEPAKAPAMAAYMKTTMPFYGVTRPAQAKIAREAKRIHPAGDDADYVRTIELLWDLPHREDKYLAIAFARQWPRFVTFDHVPLYRRMIVEGAWWDFVDEIATHLIGDVLLRDRTSMRTALDRWIDDDHLWLRRTAILSQERHRDRTDAAMLFGYCERRLDEKDFFIRKAIGWALRSYSRVDPAAVEAFVTKHGDRISGLSRREALRHIAPHSP